MEPRKFRGLCVAVFMATAIIATAQEQPTVTLSQPTMSMEKVLKAITQQTGVSVSAVTSLNDTPLLVSVKDAPLDELLARIAKVTGTKVEERDYGLLIVVDKAARKEQENRERKWTEDAFDRAKEKQAAKNKLPDRWTAASVNEMLSKGQKDTNRLTEQLRSLDQAQGDFLQVYSTNMGGSTAARSAAFRVISQLSSQVLASVGPGDRIVYATSPTRMQKRMPFIYNRIVSDFVYNHNLIASQSPSVPTNGRIEIIGSSINQKPIQGVSKMYVILTRGQQSRNVQVEVKLADRNGLFVGESRLTVSPDFGTKSNASSDEGKAIELSEISRQLAVIMAQQEDSSSSNNFVYSVASDSGFAVLETISGRGDSLPLQVPDALMRALVDPKSNEPTGFYVAESFVQAGEATGKNVVATFPDTVLPELAQKLVRGKLTTSGLIAASPSLGLNVEQDDEWMTVTPVWAANARETQFDRTEASKLFRSTHLRGFATLDEMASYSFSIVTGTPQKSLDLIYLSLINKDVAEQFSSYVRSNLDMLRLYGSLTPNMKRSVGEDLRLPTNKLRGNAKTLAERIAYRPMGGGISFMSEGSAEMTAVISYDIGSNSSERPRPPANSVMKEPTESMPNGLPANSTLVFNRKIDDGVFGSMTGVRGGKFLSAGQLGMQQGMMSNGGGGGFMSGKNYDRFKLSKIASITLAIDLGEIGKPSASFRDGWLLNGSRDLTYGQLPADFRAKVEASKQRMSDMTTDLSVIRGQRTPPPPSL